jgi:hypothetical protein
MPYTLEQNEVDKWKNHIVEVAWNMLHVTKFAYNILGWSHFHNMLHSKLGSFFNKPKTSYELWTQHKPKIDHL